MKQLNSSLKGRLRNTDLPISKCLFPLFEAVVNSIYAIDDRIQADKAFQMDNGQIRVVLNRSLSSDMFGGKADLLSLTVEDNGIGFNEDNYASFCELDSMFRASRGCKGIGRLLWLKCFSSVEVTSSYLDKQQVKKNRCFIFAPDGIRNKVNKEDNQEIGTRVALKGILPAYKKTLCKFTSETIAKALFEHCLWFFLREGACPTIKIIDGDEVVNLNDIYESYLYGKKPESVSFKIGSAAFNVLHVRLQKSESKNTISYCAGNRIVFSEKIKEIVGLYDSAIETSEGAFYYKAFVTSPYFDERVSPDRYTFLIPEKMEEECLPGEFYQLCFEEIRKNVLAKAENYLKPYLEDNIDAGKDTLLKYVDTKAPYYKPLLAGLSDDEKVVNPNSSEKMIDSYLHTKLVAKEHALIEEGHDVMKLRTGETEEEYEQRVKEYFSSAQQIKQTDLARYVLHRKHILNLLEAALQRNEDGQYYKEDKVHSIIMPMHVTSDDEQFSDNNLWIIDERLVFHHYLASDKSFSSMSVTSSDSKRRPDILLENTIYDNPLFVAEKDTPPFSTLRIVEFKRPMRDNMEAEDSTKNPIDQCMDYVEKIRNGKSLTKSGRPISCSVDIPAYCYVICDLTPTMKKICKNNDFLMTYDGLGYFGYKSQLKIYFEIISFDLLLNAAKERNSAFFDKLGISHT